MSQSTAEERSEKQIEDRVSPPGEVVYEAILREGEHELTRRNSALAWSGLAAGLSMGFSFVAEGLLRSHLPEASWTPLVAKFGYSIGFLIVILGRQQLFTKNTLTVILPFFNRTGHGDFKGVARIWAIVLTTNLVGAFLFAWLLAHTPIFGSSVRDAFAAMAQQEAAGSLVASLWRSVMAGWLVALMIWLLPFAETARVWVITLLAYIIGLAQLPHIVAGSVPAFFLVLTRHSTVGEFLGGFFVPTFFGNIIGGVAVVAALAHAEFVHEGRSRPS